MNKGLVYLIVALLCVSALGVVNYVAEKNGCGIDQIKEHKHKLKIEDINKFANSIPVGSDIVEVISE